MVLGFVFYLNLFMAVLNLDCESGRGGGGWGRLGGEHLHNLMNGTILSEKKKRFYLCYVLYTI